MTEEEYERLYEQKRAALKQEIRQQEYKVFDAQLVLQHEVKKLSDLQQKLQWLHVTIREEAEMV